MSIRRTSRASGMLLAGLIFTGTVAGFAAVSSSSPAPSAATRTPEPFAIRTAAVEPQACMDALIGGRLLRNAISGLGITSSDGQATGVEWPFRWSARILGGRVELLDETGVVVAREGDEITIGGGNGIQVWHACAPLTVTDAAG